MFLHLSVILFTGGGVSVSACTTGHMTREGSLSRGEGGLSRGVSVWGESGGRGSLSRGRGVSVQGRLSGGNLCPGGFLSGGLCSGGSVREMLPDRDPPCGNERAVRILLECILVLHCICCFFFMQDKVRQTKWKESERNERLSNKNGWKKNALQSLEVQWNLELKN